MSELSERNGSAEPPASGFVEESAVVEGTAMPWATDAYRLRLLLCSERRYTRALVRVLTACRDYLGFLDQCRRKKEPKRIIALVRAQNAALLAAADRVLS